MAVSCEQLFILNDYFHVDPLQGSAVLYMAETKQNPRCPHTAVTHPFLRPLTDTR